MFYNPLFGFTLFFVFFMRISDKSGYIQNNMFPIYRAVGVDDQLFYGGTTQPIGISVETDNGDIMSFVTKIFSERDLAQNDSMFKEFVCSFIIDAFDLRTPEAALIYFDDDFLEAFPELKERVFNSGSRYHFGSKFYPSYVMFQGQIRDTEVDLYDMENILALDAAIFNVDRRVHKPNLLVSSTSYLMIDHEKTFGVSNLQEQLERGDFSLYYTSDFKEHIFKRILKRNRNKYEVTFSTFEYFLETFNCDSLNRVRDFFERTELTQHTFDQIKSYFCALKENKTKFVDFLQNFIL